MDFYVYARHYLAMLLTFGTAKKKTKATIMLCNLWANKKVKSWSKVLSSLMEKYKF